MSILAERKRKQKWSLNPRGKDWSEDSSKFGQKLMEKMGWSQGKGLGANEDGITDHIKVSYKNDSQGMGYKDNNDQWTEHEANFTELLSSLSTKNVSETNSADDVQLKSSLEEKSQKSRARVHYHKFTRGKDLSRYSEKDLANIFGKKTLKNDPELSKIQENIADDLDVNRFGVETLNRGSMLDYFKKKLSQVTKLTKTEDSYNSGSEEESRGGFGFGIGNSSANNMQANFVSYIKESQSTQNGNECSEDISKEITSKKKKRKSNCEEISTPKRVKFNLPEEHLEKVKSCSELEGFNANVDTHLGVAKKKKKKFLKKGTLKEELEGVSNAAFDPLFSNVVIEKHFLNVIKECSEDIEDNSLEDKMLEEKLNDLQETPVKRRKKLNIGLINEGFEEKVQENMVINSKVKNKKKAKKEAEFNADSETVKSKSKIGVENPGFVDNLCKNEENLESSGKESKRKSEEGNGKSNIGIENMGFNEKLVSNEEEETCASKVKRSKKRKTEESLVGSNIGVDNLGFGETSGKKKKSKKGKQNNLDKSVVVNKESLCEETEKCSKKMMNGIGEKCGFENVGFDEHFVETGKVNLFKVEVNGKLKKKKKGAKLAGVDNPNFEVLGSPNTEDVSTNDIFNDQIEVKRKKKKGDKQKSDFIVGFDNPGLNLNTFTEENVSTCELKVPELDDMPQMDLILNVASIPVVEKESKKKGDKKSSKLLDRKMKKDGKIRGLQNQAFDKVGNQIEENVDTLTRALDDFQAEVENDINEGKQEILSIGEIGNPEGENEKLSDGTKLKFKYANFGKDPFWANRNVQQTAKKSYKHLIKGDIVVGFKETNLHEIEGYPTKLKPGKIAL